MSKIEQPSWCNYPDANIPFVGCWSLYLGLVKDENYCKEHKCECYKSVDKDEQD